MLGWRAASLQANLYDGLHGDQRRLVDRLKGVAWLAVLLFIGSFVLLDVVLLALVDDSVRRIVLRWLIIGGTCVLLTLTLSRQAIAMVSHSVRSERAARDEAEALANLAASVAAGHGIEDTLSAAVRAAADLFGGDVRCTVALPKEDGLLRVVAWNNVASAHIANFAFRPGKGVNGRAFSEARLIRIDDLQNTPGRRPDIGRTSDIRALMVAPLIADRRTLGVLSAASPTAGYFSEHNEAVLTAVARHVAVALVAAEARQLARREAAEKAAIIDQMEDAVLVADKNGQLVECNRAVATLFDMPADKLIGLSGPRLPWQFFGADGIELTPGGRVPSAEPCVANRSKASTAS